MRWLCVAPFILLSAPALAQQGLDRDALLERAQGCAIINDAGQRHACFDTLTPYLKNPGGMAATQQAVPQPKPQQQAAVQPKPPSALTAPVLLPGEAKAAKEKEVVNVSLAVKSITLGGDGKSRFTMANGQIWKQVDTTRIKNLGDGPWTAEIRKASFGSYLLKIGNSPAVRVERQN
ncbi:MAG: hypothetical protein Q8R02_03280 [Hyphomonadaceae bacterium]|nr:hypothetical protein [Hyphomonadaceae bacterium]